MKTTLKLLLAVMVFTACSKDSELITKSFPGFTANKEDAIWVVYNHNIVDRAYLTTALAAQTPAMSIGKYDTTYIQARQREVSPYSLRFYSSGEVATIVKTSATQSSWAKQSNLKWEESEGQLNLFSNTSGSWVNVATGFVDQDKMVLRIRRSFYGDTTADRDRFVIEVVYILFK